MIRVNGLSLRAGAFRLDDLSFEVPAGGHAVLMGRTGSGKTTILEAICGLHRLAAGTIQLMGRDVTRLKPAQRGIGYVPQDRALFGTMSVRENLAFALRIRRWPRRLIEARVRELADLLCLGELLDRTPAGLSGGESQRVALGRALAARPGVLLLDEPLSALDDQSRSQMHDLLKEVRRHTNVVTLHVTHHIEDARQLADQVLLLENGAVKCIAVDESLPSK
ncbi:MAG TPA: ATP-binding cassette domain-containing protein [Tepidisphaeraceae bacterium]|nr:ATP-binding cassette domain-containing protein [Tepidisphaeraceae bacterium]